MFNRPNVTLVDVKATPIERISPAGVCTTEAEYPLDIIVFATGFNAMTGRMLRMDIRGRDGIALKDVWEAGPRNSSACRSSGMSSRSRLLIGNRPLKDQSCRTRTAFRRRAIPSHLTDQSGGAKLQQNPEDRFD
jgi:cation diffusion facilitator CzcD-associated flavoprotein CzcO